jgi:hypothetical protein
VQRIAARVYACFGAIDLLDNLDIHRIAIRSPSAIVGPHKLNIGRPVPAIADKSRPRLLGSCGDRHGDFPFQFVFDPPASGSHVIQATSAPVGGGYAGGDAVIKMTAPLSLRLSAK